CCECGCGARGAFRSSPTRRSSDLGRMRLPGGGPGSVPGAAGGLVRDVLRELRLSRAGPAARLATVASRRRSLPGRRAGDEVDRRSEEHTSELQSRENLVCRLLLEK